MRRRFFSIFAGLLFLSFFVACSSQEPTGEGCKSDFDCSFGVVCVETKCVKLCELDEDCEGGSCISGFCGSRQDQGVTEGSQEKGDKDAGSPKDK